MATNNLLVIYNVIFNGHKMSTEPTESENVCLLTGYVSGWKTSPNLNAIVDQGYETNIHHLSQSVVSSYNVVWFQLSACFAVVFCLFRLAKTNIYSCPSAVTILKVRSLHKQQEGRKHRGCSLVHSPEGKPNVLKHRHIHWQAHCLHCYPTSD